MSASHQLYRAGLLRLEYKETVDWKPERADQGGSSSSNGKDGAKTSAGALNLGLPARAVSAAGMLEEVPVVQAEVWTIPVKGVLRKLICTKHKKIYNN